MEAEVLKPPVDASPDPEFEYSPDEFNKLPNEARVCLAFYKEFHERTLQTPPEVTHKVMELAGLELAETRATVSELRTSNDRHPRRLDFNRNEAGSQFTLTEAGFDFIHKELDKLR